MKLSNLYLNKMEKNKLTFEEERELFNLWKKGRENATKRQREEMKKKENNSLKHNTKK